MASFEGWTKTVALTMLFVVLLGLVIGTMNGMYGETFSIGLDTSAIESGGSLHTATISADGQIADGEVTQQDAGLSLSSSWSVAKGIYSMLVGVFTGNWIHTIIVDMMQLPSAVALVIMMLYWASLIFIVIKLFFKVREV